AAPDVGLRDLLDVYRALDARVDADRLERVLERDRVHHRAEHADVVGGGGVHVAAVLGTAPEVPATDDQCQLDAAGLRRRDLAGEGRRRRGGDAEPALAREELARQLEQRAAQGVT